MRVRLVPDTPPLPDWLTGFEHAAFVASLYGIDAAASDAAITLKLPVSVLAWMRASHRNELVPA